MAPREFCVISGIGRSLFETTGCFPDLDDRRRPFRQLRSVLNRLGYTVRETQTVPKVEDPHHLVSFDVRPEELDGLAAYPRDRLTLILWKDPISAPLNFEARYQRPLLASTPGAVTWSTTCATSSCTFRLCAG